MSIANIVFLALTVICALTALFFFARGLQARTTQARYPYGVAKQEARHDMQVNFLRAGFLVVLTLIFLAIYGLVPGNDNAATEVTATPTTSPGQATSQPTAAASNTPVREATPSALPTAVQLTATIAPTLTVTTAPTDAPQSPTAVVNSPNGLWLREAPGGTQEIELVAHETELTLLAGRETSDDIDWQEVRTPAGNEGWVAADFLIYQ